DDRELFDVAAGAEEPVADSGEQHAAHGGVGVDPRQRSYQLAQRRVVERVRRRIVQSEGDDSGVVFGDLEQLSSPSREGWTRGGDGRRPATRRPRRGLRRATWG